MKSTRRFAAIAAVATLAVCAVSAQAASMDFTSGHYPSQVSSQSSMSRADVVAQVRDAVANGTMPVKDSGSYMAAKSSMGSSLTREQVRRETAAAEAAGQLDY